MRFAKDILISILFLACFLPLHLRALNPDSSRWELKVVAEESKVRLEPDLQSPVTAILPQGSILRSYEKVGDWFRLIITDERGFVVIGYIYSGDVEILSEKSSSAKDYWGGELGFSKGINLSFKFSAGLNYFSGGDISNGTRGMYFSFADLISSLGYEENKKYENFHVGYDISADIIYNFTPNLGVGLGFGYFFTTYKNNTALENIKVFGLNAYIDSIPAIRVVPIRLGLFLTLPVHSTFSICLNAGPTLYLVKYTYAFNYICPSLFPSQEVTSHKATSNGLGFQGGVGVEINLNPRAIFFIEGQGRYAKITNFKGKIQSRPYYYWSFMTKAYTDTVEGMFYYLQGEK